MARSTRSASIASDASSSSSNSSSSSSSDSSSSSSGSSSASGSSGSTKVAGIKKAKKNKNYVFRAPYGFQPVDFTSCDLSESALASLPSSHELWAIRVPASIPTSQLDGLIIKLPSPPKTSSSAPIDPLATLKVPTSTSHSNTYHLFSTIPPTSVQPEESQLISMAATASHNPSNPHASNTSLLGNAKKSTSAGAAVELSSLSLMVPRDEGEESGKLKVVHGAITRHLHFSLASPAETGIGASKEVKDDVKHTVAGEVGALTRMGGTGLEVKDETLGNKASREQPWDRLKGCFKPAGSYTSSSQATKREALSTETQSESMDVDISPRKEKKQKKEKKVKSKQ